MKLKTLFILSLTINVVLLATFGYLQSISVEPLRSPAMFFFINQPAPGKLSEVIKTITTESATP